MKELKSSVGLGGKPAEGGEEVWEDDVDDDGYGDNDDDESEEEDVDDGLWLVIEMCCKKVASTTTGLDLESVMALQVGWTSYYPPLKLRST